MKRSIRSILRSFTPEWALLYYHKLNSVLAVLWYWYPTRKIEVVGITGTKGKSTTANFLWAILQKSGVHTGLIGTANIRIGEDEYLNHSHMTMPGPWEMQSWFSKMKKAGCEVVIIEVTSEGIKQFRHQNIDFDLGAFTNLSPEHLPSHNNSFEEYKNTKKRFFDECLPGKIVVVNADDKHADFFLDIKARKKITTSFHNKGTVNATLGKVSPQKTEIRWDDTSCTIHIGGEKNAENAFMALMIAREYGLSNSYISHGIESLSTIPGRMEAIDEGQKFSVFVDYAHEEKSMQFLMETAHTAQNDILEKYPESSPRVIVLLGAEGGGRDIRKRSLMGAIVGKMADIVIVSNVDPYDDDPASICEDIAQAVEVEGKIREENLFIREDRREGISLALSLANEHDIVFITGKGSEQTITLDGVAYSWDDRTVIREELSRILR